MTAVTDLPQSPLPVDRPRTRRPPPGGPIIFWLRANLFGSIASTIVSVLLIALLTKALVSLVQWGFLNAVFTVPGDQTAACRSIRGLGACWAVIPEKYRFILFGTYPFDQQWRPALATLTFIALFFVSSRRSFWRKELVLVWAAALVVIGLLMWGGVPGLPFVSQDRWGGLPVTLILATFGLAFGFPLGIVVALGRRSKLPAIRSLCVLYVELIRGVPLVSLLFMASVMFPLFLPDGVNIDKLLRAQIAFVLFAGAYLAEVIRGGLQAVPPQDLIYSVGLLDYLSDRRARMLVRRLYDALLPGGLLIIGNMNETALSNLWPMEFIADWTLQYRGEAEMMGWSEGLNAKECWTETEKTGRVRLLFLRKP